MFYTNMFKFQIYSILQIFKHMIFRDIKVHLLYYCSFKDIVQMVNIILRVERSYQMGNVFFYTLDLYNLYLSDVERIC